MDNTTLDLIFPAVGGRDVLSRNDGGDITSDAGLLLVSLADKKLGLTEAMADAITDYRDQDKVVHGVMEMTRERIYAICQDYEDANDLDTLRHDPALKTACNRLPKTGDALASQPTISRFENMPGVKEMVTSCHDLCPAIIDAGACGMCTNRELALFGSGGTVPRATDVPKNTETCRFSSMLPRS